MSEDVNRAISPNTKGARVIHTISENAAHDQAAAFLRAYERRYGVATDRNIEGRSQRQILHMQQFGDLLKNLREELVSA